MSQFTDEIDYENPATLAPQAPPPAPPAPPAAPPAPAAPAPTAKPPLFAQGCAILDAATTEAAIDDAARAVAALCEAALISPTHPTRVDLRDHYRARKAAIQRMAWLAMFAAFWARIWGSLRDAIEERPSLVVRPVAAPAPVAPATDAGTLVQALTQVAAEGAVMAQGQASGSLRDGSMRYVGFSDAAGYVRALAAGVTPATQAQYIGILRGAYGYTDVQIAALALGKIEQSTLPVGQGVRVDSRITLPNGKKGTIFDLPAAERRRLVGQRMTAHVAPKAEDLLVTRITGARQPRQFSWSGVGRRHTSANGQQVGACSRADLIARLAKTGHESLAPKAKSAVAHAGHAVMSLNVGGLVVRRVKSLAKECHVDGVLVPVTPAVRARWEVGRLGRTDLDLVIDLTKGNELVTHGDGTLAGKAKADYQARLDAEVYQSGELTSWLQDVLRVWFSAAQNGVNWYVPAEHSDEARVLVRSLAGRDGDGSIWGTSWCCGQAVTTEEELIHGLCAGFLDDVDTVEADYKKATEAKVGPGAYATLLARLNEHGERIGHYEQILGSEAVAPLRARVVELRATIEPLCDDSTQRFAALEYGSLNLDGDD